MFQTKKGKKLLNPLVKEWFIIIDNEKEGPYSLHDLKKDLRFTPDTLVWKRGFQEWIKARFVSEMLELFKDEPEAKPLHEDKNKEIPSHLGQQNQITLTLQQDPYQFILWILLLLLVMFYTFFRFYYNF
jgi:hypothetical protein